MHDLMNSGAAIDRMNARSREARRIDGLIAADDWDSPEQIDIRRQHAEMRVRRDLNSAIASAAFVLQTAITGRLQAKARLSNTENNIYSHSNTILRDELDFRRCTRAVTEAETKHTDAVAALADAGFAPAPVTL